MSSESKGLTASWKIVRLGDICKTTSGGTPSRSRADYYGGTIPWVKSGELCDGIVSEIGESITCEGLKSSSAKVFAKGSLLIALYGATVGKLGILSRDAATNQAVCGIFPSEVIETKYLFWYLRSIRSELIDKGQGGAQPNISQGIVKDIQVPLAPLKDQKQIVAEIEKQFSRLDEAVASLKRIQANLKRYKAAVLKAAVEGKLTEEWRKDHPNVEPADQLLKRILAERRAKWEAEELAKMQAKGMKPKDDSWKKKYKEPTVPDTANLPELPEGWVWTSMDAIIVWGPQNGIYLPKSLYKPGIAILRIDDYQDGFSRSKDELRQVEANDKDQDTYGLVEGDLVLNRVNSLTHLGKCLVIKDRNIPSLFESNMMRLRVASLIEVVFIEMYLRSKTGRRLLTGNAKWAVNQASINQDDVKITPVPLPPLHEQRFILQEIDRRLSVTEELETTVETNLKRAERLRQTILQRAFSGGMVA